MLIFVYHLLKDIKRMFESTFPKHGHLRESSDFKFHKILLESPNIKVRK